MMCSFFFPAHIHIYIYTCAALTARRLDPPPLRGLLDSRCSSPSPLRELSAEVLEVEWCAHFLSLLAPLLSLFSLAPLLHLPALRYLHICCRHSCRAQPVPVDRHVRNRIATRTHTSVSWKCASAPSPFITSAVLHHPHACLENQISSPNLYLQTTLPTHFIPAF